MTNKKILTLISLLLFLFLMVGCELFPINQPPVITSTPVETATVGVAYTYDVDATDPNPGDVLTYSLVSVEPPGMEINSGSGKITWAPTIDDVGDVDVTVEVSDGKLSDTQDFTITVSVAELTGIEVIPETMTLFVGGSETITSVTAHYSDGSTASTALGDCTYLSNDVTVATIVAGVVKGIGVGKATITVSYGGKTDTLEVTVNPVLLTSIVVLPETMTLFVGDSETITSVTAHYDDGSTAVKALGDCTYLSSDEDVATVVAGVIAAVGVGEAIITVSYGGKTDTLEVTVNSIRLTSIVVLPETMTFFVGDDREAIKSITAHYSDESTAEIDLDDDACEYESSDEDVATVDAGEVTAVGVGEATITVSYTEGEITTKAVLIKETDTIEVTVTRPVHNIDANRYYDDIQAAIDDASAGDTIEVAAGTYNEIVNIYKSNIVVKSASGAEVTTIIAISAVATVDFIGAEPGFGLVENSVLDGFTVINEFMDGPFPVVVRFQHASGSVAKNNVIIGPSTDTGTHMSGVVISGEHDTGSNNVLEDNTISNCWNGFVVFGPHADGNIIRNNIVEENSNGAWIEYETKNTVVQSNDIINNILLGIGIDEGYWGTSENISINYNNIYGNGFGIKADYQSLYTPVDATNNWWGDESGPTHPSTNGTGDIVSDNVVFVPFSTVEN